MVSSPSLDGSVDSLFGASPAGRGTLETPVVEVEGLSSSTFNAFVFSSRAATPLADGLDPAGETVSVGASFLSRVFTSIPWAFASSKLIWSFYVSLANHSSLNAWF